MVKHWLSNMFDPAGSRVYGPPARVCLTAGSNVRTGTSMPVSGGLIGSFRHATTWWRRSSKWDFLFRMSGTESNWPCWRARRVILARERSFQCWLFRLSSGRGPTESSAVEAAGVDEVLLIAENARPASSEKLAGCRSQSYFVPLKRSSPAARRRLFSARRT